MHYIEIYLCKYKNIKEFLVFANDGINIKDGLQ